MIQSNHLQVPVIHFYDTLVRGDGGGSYNPNNMLDANDVRMFEEILDRKLEEKLEQKLDQKLSVFRDEILEKVSAELHRELYKVRNDIIDVVNGVLPQIDKLDHRVTRLERWARMV